MKSNKLTNQGGSVATFVVVGVVLAAFMIGGVYLLQKRSQDGQKSGPVAVNTPSPVAPSASSDATKKPSQSPAKPTPTKTSTPKPTPQPTSTIPTTASLPTTGPAEDFLGAFMLASLIGVAAAWLRSYRVRYGYQTE